jgi:hypothetical protein
LDQSKYQTEINELWAEIQKLPRRYVIYLEGYKETLDENMAKIDNYTNVGRQLRKLKKMYKPINDKKEYYIDMDRKLSMYMENVVKFDRAGAMELKATKEWDDLVVDLEQWPKKGFSKNIEAHLGHILTTYDGFIAKVKKHNK